MNQIYLNTLKAKSKASIHQIDQELNFSQLDFINAFIVKKSLKIQKSNLWVYSLKKDIDTYFKPLIYSLLIEFFHKNYFNDKNILVSLGDKFHRENLRYEVIEIGQLIGDSEAVKLKCISRGKKENLIITMPLESLNDPEQPYIKVNNESGSSNRSTFKPLLNLVNKLLKIPHNFQSFPNKFALICSKKHFEQSFSLKDRKAFPYMYITRNEETVPNLPLDDCMFYVAPDYETIQDYVLDDDIKLDVVVFFGKDEFQVQQDINRGLVNKVIYFGDKEQSVDNLIKWKWTAPEIQYLKDSFDTNSIKKPIEIENIELETITTNFLEKLQIIEDTYGINLRSIYSYISYIYPIVIPSADSRLSNRILDLEYRFKKKLEEVLVQEFSVIGIDHTQSYNELLSIYNDALSQVEYANNSKFKQLNQLINDSNDRRMNASDFIDKIDTPIDPIVPPKIKQVETWKSNMQKRLHTRLRDARNYEDKLKKQSKKEEKIESQKLKKVNYLLVPPRQTIDIWKNEVRKMNWHNTEVISISKLRDIKKQSSITVLSLEDMEFFENIYTGIHNVKWLLYKHENVNYKRFKKKYHNQLIEEFGSKDRKRISGIEFKEKSINETTEGLIDRIYDAEYHEGFREYQSSYQDHIFKEIQFTDKTVVTLSANSSVIIVDKNNRLIINRVGDLRVDDKVRIYENHHKDLLFKNIIESDTQGKFLKILEDSQKWKDILGDYCSSEEKIVEIANNCGIAPSTVEGWFSSNSTTKFPQNISKIRNYLGQDYDEIFRSNKIYISIMIAAGRDLSDEISDYLINKVKGPFLEKLGNEIIQKITEHNMPKRTIESIQIIELAED
jgi:hypothetical protein